MRCITGVSWEAGSPVSTWMFLYAFSAGGSAGLAASAGGAGLAVTGGAGLAATGGVASGGRAGGGVCEWALPARSAVTTTVLQAQPCVLFFIGSTPCSGQPGRVMNGWDFDGASIALVRGASQPRPHLP